MRPFRPFYNNVGSNSSVDFKSLLAMRWSVISLKKSRRRELTRILMMMMLWADKVRTAFGHQSRLFFLTSFSNPLICSTALCVYIISVTPFLRRMQILQLSHLTQHKQSHIDKHAYSFNLQIFHAFTLNSGIPSCKHQTSLILHALVFRNRIHQNFAKNANKVEIPRFIIHKKIVKILNSIQPL